MERRSPVPTPRRSCRTRQPPQRFEEYVTEMPSAQNVPEVARSHDSGSQISATSNVSTTSRHSVLSARSAALRVELLRKEHELQRRSEEASRALELHRACSELEVATLQEQELNTEVQAQECPRNEYQLLSQADNVADNAAATQLSEEAGPRGATDKRSAGIASTVTAPHERNHQTTSKNGCSGFRRSSRAISVFQDASSGISRQRSLHGASNHPTSSGEAPRRCI